MNYIFGIIAVASLFVFFNLSNNSSSFAAVSFWAKVPEENKNMKNIKNTFFTYFDIGVAPVSKLMILPSLNL